MRRFVSKFTHKLVIFVLALLIATLATAAIEKRFNVSPKLSQLTGDIAGVFIENGSSKFLPSANVASAQGSAPYQNVSGNVSISGNVGIGTTNPGAKLEVSGAGEGIRITGSGTTGASSVGYLSFYDSNGSTRKGYIGDGSSGNTDIYLFADIGNRLRFGSNGTVDQMVLNAGNVGIGTANPTTALDINGSGKSTGGFVATGYNTAGWSGIGAEIGMASNTAYFTGYNRSTSGYTATYFRGGPVYLTSTGATTAANIYLQNNGLTNFTLDYNGNVTITGSLTATSKNFEIDHPVKPGYKLVHSSLEGPEIGVYYRGESQLIQGKTIVILPDYFEALTSKENRTILLTPKFDSNDEPISNLAASIVTNGKFSVRATDKVNPSQKFYWEVKAIRKDVTPLIVEKSTDQKK